MDRIPQPASNSQTDFYRMMNTLIKLDNKLQSAISVFAGYDLYCFEEKLSRKVEDIYETIHQVYYESEHSTEKKDLLSSELEALLDRIENVSLTLHSKCSKRLLMVLHNLIQLRCKVLHIRWEFGCFAAIDAIRTAYLVYRRIDIGGVIPADNSVLAPPSWRNVRTRVQEAMYEWEVAHKAITLFIGQSEDYLDLSQQTLRRLNELMIAVHVKSPQHFNKNYSELINIYRPFCHHLKVAKAD